MHFRRAFNEGTLTNWVRTPFFQAIEAAVTHHGDGVMGENIPDALEDSEVVSSLSELFYAGFTRHGHAVVGCKVVGGEIRVLAGCRSFTLEEAQRHWDEPLSSTATRREVNQHMRALLADIEAWANSPTHVAAALGDAPLTVPVYDKCDVEEFLGEKMAAMLRNWIRYNKGESELNLTRAGR